jgi:hypothetical protein
MEIRRSGKSRERERINSNIAVSNNVLDDDDLQPLSINEITSDIRLVKDLQAITECPTDDR